MSPCSYTIKAISNDVFVVIHWTATLWLDRFCSGGPSKKWVARSSRARDASFKFGAFRPESSSDFRQVNGSHLSKTSCQVNDSPHRL